MALVSILILTKNEEVNIERCIQSVSWSDDIVVFDSFSEDKTVELAHGMGARVEQRIFDNYANQRNAAMSLLFKHEWILMIDADEYVTPELHREITLELEHVDPEVTMFRMRRKDFFFGKWIKHASVYPTWFGRLIRHGTVRVEREINEEYHTDGEVRCLQEHLVHYPFSNGLTYWIERHNRYSSMEARALIQEVKGAFCVKELWSSDATIRRKTLKQLAYRLHGRPALVFIYLYLIRGGWLDGVPGFRYSIMRSIYECMINLKVAELKYQKKHSEKN